MFFLTHFKKRGHLLLSFGLFFIFMKFEKINYKKTFNLGNYSTHTIGVEIGLDEKEDPMFAIQTASELVHEYHKQSTGGLDHSHIEITTIPDIQVEGEPKPTTLVDDINSCKDIKTLESYRLIVKGNATLRQVYNEKLDLLSKPSN